MQCLLLSVICYASRYMITKDNITYDYMSYLCHIKTFMVYTLPIMIISISFIPKCISKS